MPTNKWKIGHTFGYQNSKHGVCILMMQNNTFVGVPFESATTKKNTKVLVNAVGFFGGNAVSVLLSL
jgi:hypothetical protein